MKVEEVRRRPREVGTIQLTLTWLRDERGAEVNGVGGREDGKTSENGDGKVKRRGQRDVTTAGIHAVGPAHGGLSRVIIWSRHHAARQKRCLVDQEVCSRKLGNPAKEEGVEPGQAQERAHAADAQASPIPPIRR